MTIMSKLYEYVLKSNAIAVMNSTLLGDQMIIDLKYITFYTSHDIIATQYIGGDGRSHARVFTKHGAVYEKLKEKLKSINITENIKFS